MKYSFKVVLLHITIAGLYLGFLAYLFVTAKQPNPIGYGIRQLVFMVLHLLLTAAFMYRYISQPQNKKDTTKKFAINVIVVLLIITVAILTNNLTSRWLWSLR